MAFAEGVGSQANPVKTGGDVPSSIVAKSMTAPAVTSRAHKISSRSHVTGEKKTSVVPEATSNAQVKGASALPAEWQAQRIGQQPDSQDVVTTPVPAAPDKTSAAPTAGASPAGSSASDQRSDSTGQAAVERIFLPFGDSTAVAGFWSGNDFLLVADRAVPMDASALKDTGPFSHASVQTMGNTTVVSIHFDQSRELSLHKQTGGWILSLVHPQDEGAHRSSISPEQRDGGLLYPLPGAGRVIEIADPASGARLLVAPSSAEVPGPVLTRHHVGYELRPSLQGLVFAVESDQVEVRNGDGGPFLDILGKNGIPLAGGASGRVADDRVDWAWLGLRALPSPMLREDYRRLWTRAAMLPPPQRDEARLAAARAAFAMGDAPGARAILATAIQDRPDLASLPNVAFLQAASELLAGNTAGAGALESPEAGADGVLWRGLYMARSGGNPKRAASLLAEGYLQLRDYPEPLRQKLAPEIAHYIAQYGSDEDRTVLTQQDTPPLDDLTQALLTLRNGDQEKALGMFSHLAASKDPVVSERGNEEAIALKLAMKRIRPAEAATAYDRLLFAARQAGREKDVRHGLIDALMQAGEWPRALVALDKSVELFPEERVSLTPKVEEILIHLAESSADEHSGADTIDTVAMIQSHVDQIPDGPAKGRILAGLGQKLMAIGLPGKAATAFERALPLAPDETRRAAWGGELAQADIAAQRLGQARRALDETADTSVDGDVASKRRVIAAGLLLREGNRDQALLMLAQDESDASLDLRGRILEEQRKWPDAVLVVGRLATHALPETGVLSLSQQELALRLATDAARANDWGTLDRLREWVGSRKMTPERQRVFNLLVTSPEEDLRRRAEAP
ncbi:tetratricopeptide repeat protein [Acetobacter estunensis]|uniref:tetratricopeptide repeat protein n=1 Tax=Acetobacter estunensis TaxID=104097 RepID=UPI00140D4253